MTDATPNFLLKDFDKIKAGIAAADRGDFASDDEVARVRKKFAAKDREALGIEDFTDADVAAI